MQRVTFTITPDDRAHVDLAVQWLKKNEYPVNFSVSGAEVVAVTSAELSPSDLETTFRHYLERARSFAEDEHLRERTWSAL